MKPDMMTLLIPIYMERYKIHLISCGHAAWQWEDFAVDLLNADL